METTFYSYRQVPVLPSTIAKLDNLPRVFSWKYFGAPAGDFLGYCFWMFFSHVRRNSPKTQDVTWTYIRCPEDVPDVFWASYVRSTYVLCLQGYRRCMWKKSVLKARVRSSHLEAFCNKSVLKNVVNFKGKHLCRILFFKKTC